MRTSNIEHPTSNIEVKKSQRTSSLHFDVGCSVLDFGYSHLIRRKSWQENKKTQDINEDPDRTAKDIRVFVDIVRFLVFVR